MLKLPHKWHSPADAVVVTVDAAEAELIVTVAIVAYFALKGAVVVGVARLTVARPESVVVAL